MRFLGPGDSSSVIEGLLDQKATELGKHLSADVLTYFGPITNGVDVLFREAIDAMRQPKSEKLVVILETEGGFIEVVERMVVTMRQHYKTVDFVVPNFAMSAGTVLVMSGDAIHMDYFSILGPIDPQIPRPDGSFVPAVGYLKQFERLIQKANQNLLNQAEATFLVEKFDPAELYQYERSEALSVSLLKEWLAKYKFKNWHTTETKRTPVDQKTREQRAEQIATILKDTDRWHSHGRGISADVLRSIGLQINDFQSDKVLNDGITEFYRLAADFKQKHGLAGILHVSGTMIPIMGGRQ